MIGYVEAEKLPKNVWSYNFGTELMFYFIIFYKIFYIQQETK